MWLSSCNNCASLYSKKWYLGSAGSTECHRLTLSPSPSHLIRSRMPVPRRVSTHASQVWRKIRRVWWSWGARALQLEDQTNNIQPNVRLSCDIVQNLELFITSHNFLCFYFPTGHIIPVIGWGHKRKKNLFLVDQISYLYTNTQHTSTQDSSIAQCLLRIWHSLRLWWSINSWLLLSHQFPPRVLHLLLPLLY